MQFKFLTLYLFLLHFDFNLCLSCYGLPEVETPLGKIRGDWKRSFEGRKYASFEGIPFAKPPLGDFRFEAPVPVTPWSGIWNATNPQKCIQYDPIQDVIEGNEDCLYLNVYVPAEFLNTSKQLHVVVHFHGGGFYAGSAHEFINANFSMDEDIVLVTPNYRLGLLGFLSTGDGVIPGNNGLKDQVQVLRWVKDNIASFSGDPNCVTIDGHSAGGASTHFHYFSPLSKGLFQRGISRSGTVLSPWSILDNASERTNQLAALVGCPTSNNEVLKTCLKRRPAHSLLGQLKHLYGYRTYPPVLFGPVVERGSKSPFLEEHPYLLMKQGRVLDAPWITSLAPEEGLVVSVYFWDKMDEVNSKWPEVFQHLLLCNYTLPPSERKNVSRKILDHYLGPGEKFSNETFLQFSQLFSDRYFAVSGEISARLQANVTKSPVYFYFFNYRDGENDFQNSSQFMEFKGVYAHLLHVSRKLGVSHGEELIYLNGLKAIKPFSEQDKRMRTILNDMLYSFVSTGKPSFNGTDTWQPTESSQLTYLNITAPENIKLQTVENLTPHEFWSTLGLLEHENMITKNEL